MRVATFFVVLLFVLVISVAHIFACERRDAQVRGTLGVGRDAGRLAAGDTGAI